MKRLPVICIAVGLAGCNAGAGGSPDVRAQAESDPYTRQAAYVEKQLPYLIAYTVASYQLADQHKTTYVQAANDVRKQTRAVFGFALSPSLSDEMDYAVKVARMIDAEQISPEAGTRLRQQRHAEHEAQRATEALPVAAAPTRLQTNCMTMPLGGGFTNTTCN